MQGLDNGPPTPHLDTTDRQIDQEIQMQSDKCGRYPPDDDSGDVLDRMVQSPKDALRRELKTLQVAAGADVMFSPHDREFADYFGRVAVKTFDDLKVLGFVPRGLAEDKVRSAIAADEEEAYKVALTRTADAPAPHRDCDCQGSPAANATGGTSSSLRQRYVSARKAFNPTLARVLAQHLQTRVEWDSPTASIVRNWVSYIDRPQQSAISIALLSDITIDRGATLRVDRSTKALFAGTIYIHRTGQLIYDGGYLKIWASAISSFIGLATTVTSVTDIPWLTVSR
jgi:hypothetical protein